MLALFLSISCLPSRDTLAGTWATRTDEVVRCDGVSYTVEMAINEVQDFEYTGQLLFRYTKEVSGGDFYANLLYEFQALQPVVAGSQEVYFYDIFWSDLGCKTIYSDGTEQAGGCQANGLDTSDFEEKIGDLTMDFNGIDRLVIDDGNCQGAIYRE